MDDSTAIKVLIGIIVLQSFFSVGINSFTYALPPAARHFVSGFSGQTIDLETTAQELEDNLQRQTNIPVIDVGALVFYSGNMFLDFLLNFAFAIPVMIGIFFNGITMLFSLNTQLVYYVQAFFVILQISLYFLSLIMFITGYRSGRVVGS